MQEFSLRGYASAERRSSRRRNYWERRSRVTLCFHPVAKSGRQGWALGGQGEQSQRRHARMLAPSGGGSNRGLASVRAGAGGKHDLTWVSRSTGGRAGLVLSCARYK